jgi:hypothetical protein
MVLIAIPPNSRIRPVYAAGVSVGLWGALGDGSDGLNGGKIQGVLNVVAVCERVSTMHFSKVPGPDTFTNSVNFDRDMWNSAVWPSLRMTGVGGTGTADSFAALRNDNQKTGNGNGVQSRGVAEGEGVIRRRG